MREIYLSHHVEPLYGKGSYNQKTQYPVYTVPVLSQSGIQSVYGGGLAKSGLESGLCTFILHCLIWIKINPGLMDG